MLTMGCSLSASSETDTPPEVTRQETRLPLEELRIFAEAFDRISKAYVEDVDDNVFAKNPDDAPPPRAALLDPEPVEEEPKQPKPRRKQRTTKETEQV